MPPLTQYAQIADLPVAGVQLDALTAAFTTPQLNEALTNASRLLDGYFRNQWGSVMPFSFVGADVVRATCIIAAYDLLVSRGYNPAAGGDPAIKDRYKEIIGTPPHQLGWADLVSRGSISPDLIGVGGVEGQPPARARAVSSSQRGWSGRAGTQQTSRSTNGPFSTD